MVRRRERLVFTGLITVFALFACCSARAGAAVSDAWARATPPNAPSGAVFLTLEGDADGDRLVAASSPVAETVELHTHLREPDTGIMRMRPVEAIAVPAGETVTLQPGGRHIMLIGLTETLEQGGTLPLMLTFEKSGALEVEAMIMAPGATGPDPGQSDGQEGDHGDGHGK